MPIGNVSLGTWDVCTAYYSNAGPVRERVLQSQRGMPVEHAVRGYREEDHLTKRERRELRKTAKSGRQSIILPV